MRENTAEGENKPTGNLKTKISYCPRMDLYRYSQAGEDDCLFDTPMLEKSIEAYMQNQEEQKAQFMAQLTAFARKWPHCEVSFFDDGSFKVVKLQPKKDEENAQSLPDDLDVSKK